MTRSGANDTPATTLRDTSWLSIAAIALIAIIMSGAALDIAGRVGKLVVAPESNWHQVLHAFLPVFIPCLPTFIIAGVLGDFAGLFSRTGEGEVFTPRNLKALRSAGSGLIWAAAASAIIVPTLLSWTTGDGRGFIWNVNDLALGTGAMGLAILGLSHVFAEGIRLKTDSDQII